MRKSSFFFILAIFFMYLHCNAETKNHKGDRRKEFKNTLTADAFLGGIGFGYVLGLDYERYLGYKGKLSFMIPFYIANGVSQLGEIDDQETARSYHGYYFAPGIKYHPLGAFHRADLSVGAQFIGGNANWKYIYYYGGAHPATYDIEPFVCFMGSININVNPYKTMATLGFQIGFSNAFNQAGISQRIFHFGLKLGRRF